MCRYLRLVFATMMLLQSSSGYPYFPGKIPNGGNVPNPCKPEELWPGVGHKLQAGNGARNPFGVDFAASGKMWTTELCQMDSDGDGRLNGFELGDPNCTWTPGSELPTGLTISHPGICEPWNDPKCLALDQDWVMEACQPKEFDCPAINQQDVIDIEVSLPSTRVPAKETTYICQIFTMPETDNHMIATTPIINNTDVVHHIVLFGCDGDAPKTNDPFICGMVPSSNCSEIISVWTPGSSGECLHQTMGFKVGGHGFKEVALQIHWNNPIRRSDYSDQSGMVMYLTPNLRDSDAGILTTGQRYLWIPPKERNVVRESIFPVECSQEAFTGNIYVTAVLNHMHYLGTSHSLILYRDGVKLREIAVDEYYNYDNPKLHFFDEPIEVRPGDELKTTCVYSSLNRNFTTQFGDATSDEMCFSFLTFYPLQNLKRSFVSSYKSIGSCHMGDTNYQGCNMRTFPDHTDPVITRHLADVTRDCVLFEACTQKCYDTIQAAKQHSCLKGDVWDYLIYRMFRSIEGVNFILRLQSCACGLPSEAPPALTPITGTESSCDWPGLVKRTPTHPLLNLYTNIKARCVAIGLCLKECIPAVMEARSHRCFQGSEWHYGRRYMHQSLDSIALEFLMDFESCNCEISAMPTNPETTTPETGTAIPTHPDTTTPVTGTAAVASSFAGILTVAMLYTFLLFI